MDVVSEILRIVTATGVEHWERRIRSELGGRRWYIATSTGRQHVRELVRLGIAERSARAKVYGK
jgi:hypothetical protein